MLFDPSGKVVVVKFAAPEVRVLLPSADVPFLKVTLPVGVPPKDDETVAVNVTGAPDTDGFTDEIKPVVLGDTFTTCDTGAEVLPLKLASPL
jgi:hypothetical protein